MISIAGIKFCILGPIRRNIKHLVPAKNSHLKVTLPHLYFSLSICASLPKVAYKECKSTLFSSMFEELFKPHDSTNPEQQDQIECAKQQARIYGYLCELMVHPTPKAILSDVITAV